MNTEPVHAVTQEWAERAWIDAESYADMYARSLDDPEGFWAEQARRIHWMRPPTKIKNTSFQPVSIRWYEDGVLNVTESCLDRHAREHPDRVAILWEGDEPDHDIRITYGELTRRVCRFANALKARGIGKGDRVTIYMPMIPDAAVAMLACARIGAIHSVVFGGFSPEALRGRIEDCESCCVITANEGVRGGKTIPLKANTDIAVAGVDIVHTVMVVRHTETEVPMKADRDVWVHDLVAVVSDSCPPAPMDAEDPLFILYTSGSTGKPKGVLHTCAGYLIYAAITHKYVFDIHEDDIYWCTADVGWVTGHSYIVYGPLANGATTLMFEGVPTYPDVSRFWQVVDKHKVTVLYTAPTAVRALMRFGDEPVRKTSRQSLRLLGSVGEPINPEAWTWFHSVVGDGRCPIMDTWWQTETGGHMITPLPGVSNLKPGSAMRPFFGVRPEIVDAKGAELTGACEGNLVIADSWPGQMRTVYGDHQRFLDTYFSTYPGRYFTGDGARRDADGCYWITGRVDDVINVSGHRLGTAEIESSLVSHPAVSEAAVVGFPHDIKGQGIYVFVTLMAGAEGSDTMRKDLISWVRKEIGPIASPDALQFAPALPKTRSGKIMRRILRKVAENAPESIGDTSTLADPDVVPKLLAERAPV